jgi:hypothetical protein
MRVGIHEAKTNLSRLIPAVRAGEEVIITKAANRWPDWFLSPKKKGGGPWVCTKAK